MTAYCLSLRPKNLIKTQFQNSQHQVVTFTSESIVASTFGNCNVSLDVQASQGFINFLSSGQRFINFCYVFIESLCQSLLSLGCLSTWSVGASVSKVLGIDST